MLIVVLGREGRFPKSLLTTFTEADAKIARDQLTALQNALRDAPETVDDVLTTNNDWNPTITNLDELRRFSDENNWDLDEGIIAYKERNSYVQDIDADDATYRMAFSDYVEKEASRQDRVLPEFGGKKTYNVDPMDTITQQFGTAVQ
jgi:transposase-like protein